MIGLIVVRGYPTVIAETMAGLERAGGRIEHDPLTDILTVNGEFTASMTILRCFQTQTGSLRWKVRLDRGLLPDLTIAVRMDRGNERIRDYLLLPSLDMDTRTLSLAECNGIWFDAYRFDNLEPLFEMAEQVLISEAA